MVTLQGVSMFCEAMERVQDCRKKKQNKNMQKMEIRNIFVHILYILQGDYCNARIEGDFEDDYWLGPSYSLVQHRVQQPIQSYYQDFYYQDNYDFYVGYFSYQSFRIARLLSTFLPAYFVYFLATDATNFYLFYFTCFMTF